MIDFKARGSTKRFDFLGKEGHFWLSSAVLDMNPNDPVPFGEGVWDFVLWKDAYTNNDGKYLWGSRYKTTEGVSVRCIKDPPKK